MTHWQRSWSTQGVSDCRCSLARRTIDPDCIIEAIDCCGHGSFLGESILPTIFMQIRGKQILRRYFSRYDLRQMELSGRQSFYVVMFVIALSIYIVWVFA